mmetsp:Transcript_6246/g.18850  ORF Transcript_6246/g.18850 Transcript_6246/m.18850 type:complete len:232 (+) Transcript_6246:1906-2601(+)
MCTRLSRSFPLRSLYSRASRDDIDGKTRVSAVWKSSAQTLDLWERRAHTVASRTSAARSAPLNPEHTSDVPICFRSTSPSSGVLDDTARRMSALSSAEGRGTYKSLSKRPGRSIAGSMMSGRLVAAMTNTCFLLSMPSSSVSSWFTTRSVDPESLPPSASPLLRGAKASSSSKKTTHGEEARALWKSLRTLRSDSPTNLLRSSGPFTEMKFALLSLATAFASRVFPQPGGP